MEFRRNFGIDMTKSINLALIFYFLFVKVGIVLLPIFILFTIISYFAHFTIASILWKKHGYGKVSENLMISRVITEAYHQNKQAQVGRLAEGCTDRSLCSGVVTIPELSPSQV